MVLAGEMITAQEAHRIGLVNEVTVGGGVDSASGSDCGEDYRQCAAGGAVCHGGREQRHGDDLSEGLYLEAVLFAVACATEDKKEGTSAFLEKRAAQFKGK
jgi:enoyl-CoA hydratase